MAKLSDINADKLISAVKKRPALYNKNDPLYYNSHKRHKANLWTEVAREVCPEWDSLKPQDKVECVPLCKEKWRRIKDNFAKAIKLRKTKTDLDEGLPLPRHYHLLSSIVQLTVDTSTDNETKVSRRRSSLSDTYSSDEDSEDSDESSSNIKTPKISNTQKLKPKNGERRQIPSTSTNIRSKAVNDDDPLYSDFHHSEASSSYIKTPSVIQSTDVTAASITDEYFSNTESTTNRKEDTLIDFFVLMAKTVKKFPLKKQIEIKAKLFQLVHEAEMEMSEEDNEMQKRIKIES